jgi:hypothetical protein
MRERYDCAAMASPPAEQSGMPVTMRDADSRAGKAPAAPAQPLVDLLGPRIRLRPFRNDEVETAWQGLAQQDEAAHRGPWPGCPLRTLDSRAPSRRYAPLFRYQMSIVWQQNSRYGRKTRPVASELSTARTAPVCTRCPVAYPTL